jgi:hypothetical protein
MPGTARLPTGSAVIVTTLAGPGVPDARAELPWPGRTAVESLILGSAELAWPA